MIRFALAIVFMLISLASVGSAQVLDKQKLLEAQTFWCNRDFDWYKANIPFFECPDGEINTTYYYRWELVTRHLCYGSPNSGYSFTEFADRPFWSGAYGSISCPSGHQIYEVRWLHDPRYARDYLRYWFRTPGAQPRNYSSWLADSAWATHLVQPNKQFIVDLLPDLVENYRGWKQRHWVPEMEMFWQTGHDDGMEFNINSRQTMDILRGDRAFRPTFNTYMWADANAIARVADLAGDADIAKQFREQAAGLKTQIQDKLWDDKRQFFFPMSSRDEKDKEGNIVKAHTLTYQSGKHAGSPHGRELHGYVPWAFNLPDAGYEDAWKYLMDADCFYAPFGPLTTERNDPMFLLQPGCCWWSGQSWPFATTQTLKALANVLQNYRQNHVSRDDYVKMLHQFAVEHRKDGRPYIAEALNPDTGSWAGHDAPGHSEHYFHSNFNDLLITGLVGLQTADSEILTIDPLAPASWDYFALDSVPYRGHNLTVIWDKSGDRYGLGAGLRVLVDGKEIASSPKLGKINVKLPGVREVPLPKEVRLNYSVNNDGDYYPRYDASFIGENSSLSMICDGQYVYDLQPANRWTTVGSTNESDWISIDLGTPRSIDTVQLYLIDDGQDVIPPASFELAYWDGEVWKAVPSQRRTLEKPVGGRPNTITFPLMNIQRLQVMFPHSENGRTGLTEMQMWGPGELPYSPAPPPAGNIAVNTAGKGFPKATASFHDIYGGVPALANDGKINYQPNPVNRWTSYGSPNKTDWLEIDFGTPKTFGRVELHIYDDHGGVQPPASYAVQFFESDQWKDAANVVRSPEKPKGSAMNTVKFDAITSNKVRVVFTHAGQPRSGLTEIEVWEK